MESGSGKNDKIQVAGLIQAERFWRIGCSLWVILIIKELPEYLPVSSYFSPGLLKVLGILVIGILPMYLADKFIRPRLFNAFGIKTQQFNRILTTKNPKFNKLIYIVAAFLILYIFMNRNY